MNNKNLDNRNKKITTGITIAIAVLLILGGIWYSLNGKNNGLKSKIIVLKVESNDRYEVVDDKEYNSWFSSKEAYEVYREYVCKTDNCHAYTYENGRFESNDKLSAVYHSDIDTLVVYDDGPYLYNFKTAKRKKIENIPENTREINIITNPDNDIIALWVSTRKFHGALYNYKTKKTVTDDVYTKIEYINNNYVRAISESGINEIVLDLNGNEVYTTDDSIYYNNDTGLYLVCDYKSICNKILDDNFKEKIKDFNNYEVTITTNKKIYVYRKGFNTYYEYNLTGSKLNESKEFDEIISILKDWVVVINNNKVYVVDLVKNKEIELLENTSNIHIFGAWWYSQDSDSRLCIDTQNVSTNELFQTCYTPSTGETSINQPYSQFG